MTGPGESLPHRFPIFPLHGSLLLPGGSLPLNVFEPRYLQMVRDAMQTDRVIGMIQPRQDEDPSPRPELFRTGCAGRISNFAETEDGRYLITLTGLCRFDVDEELEVDTPYRQVVADFQRWRHDLQPSAPPASLKTSLLGVLKGYFAHHGIEADWTALRNAPLAALITSLAMICPFEASEKQALLEAGDMEEQGKLLVALMAMDAVPTTGAESTLRH
ncbi:MAG TPA: LON peptidase substrate-binding domain-containing protein [Geminicoccaceae bacterium]|nr:LON peptidase substrate-binding domain-containing protein [Geminicoccaceae bacterium]